MMRTPKQFIVGAACLCMLAGTVYAAPDIELWETDEAGWAHKNFPGLGAGWGDLDQLNPVGSHGGALTVNALSAPSAQIDILYATSASDASGLVGDLSLVGTDGWQVIFDFYSEDEAPAQLDVYLLHDVGSDNFIWLNTVSATGNGWDEGISANLGGGGWYSPNGGTDFSADLIDIDEIGVMISWNEGDSTQLYGLDNFEVAAWDTSTSTIPEPETWAMLGIAFLSIGFSFRHRLDEVVDGLKVRIRS